MVPGFPARLLAVLSRSALLRQKRNRRQHGYRSDSEGKPPESIASIASCWHVFLQVKRCSSGCEASRAGSAFETYQTLLFGIK
jgi:hypothetical protein